MGSKSKIYDNHRERRITMRKIPVGVVLVLASVQAGANAWQRHALVDNVGAADLVVLGTALGPAANEQTDHAGLVRNEIRIDLSLKGATSGVIVLSNGSISEARPACCVPGKAYLMLLIRTRTGDYQSVNGPFSVMELDPSATCDHRAATNAQHQPACVPFTQRTNSMTWPAGADGDVFRRLAADDFNFNLPHVVDYNVDFDSWPPDARALDILHARYGDLKLHPPTQQGGGYVEFHIASVLTYEAVIETQRSVSAAMQEFGGICDSWGVMQDG